MGMVMLGILATLPQPSPPPIPAIPLTSIAETDINIKDNTSSSIFILILILPVIFFLAGLVLILSREVSHLLRPTDRNPDDREGHLQQLFHLHDSGMDQCFIDSLPVFLYKAIIGLRDPFDCAVCLCGFEADDKLRLLPKCGHAFHVECIDTWLLCHSTCPLCRKTLLPDYSTSNGSSPACFVLDTVGESSSSIEVASDKMDSVLNVPMDFPGEDVIGTSDHKCSPNPWETGDKQDMGSAISEASEERMVPVKLGKFQNMDVVAGGGGEGSSSGINNLNERRCLSMGSYKYAVDEISLLRVAVRLPKQKSCITKPGHRLAMSEGDCDLTSERFKDFDSPSKSEPEGYGGSAGTGADAHKKESFSFPKILLRPKKEREIAEDCSRRASSFQLPLYQVSTESKLRCDDSLSTSEFDISVWEERESEMGLDVEVGSCDNSRDS